MEKCNHDYTIQESFKVCSICGIVDKDFLDTCNISYNVIDESGVIKSGGKSKSKCSNNSKLSKMIKWNMYSNQDKNQYKLIKATKELLENFNFNENIINSICNLVVKVIKGIGSKRAKVKEAVIIVCTYYILKYNGITHYTQSNLASLIGLESKSISKADKLILEYINCESNKEFSKEFINVFDTTEKSIDYITTIIQKYDINIPNHIIEKTEQLIMICEDNDILLDHTPLSVGVACFYYILKENNTKVDIKLFSEIYNQSIVTITKTYSKLLPFKTKLNQLLDTFQKSESKLV
jgi:transcription initiation factor TFIIIB Brf1 subunit/transcription initiation factor TFIIB